MIKTRWRLFGNLRKGMEKMDKKDEIMLVNHESLAEKIYIIRGQKVMLDFELAEIYGYETKRFNEQVKNNIEKFDDDFRFQLTKEEWENLRSKISTSKSETGSGGRRYLRRSSYKRNRKGCGKAPFKRRTDSCRIHWWWYANFSFFLQCETTFIHFT